MLGCGWRVWLTTLTLGLCCAVAIVPVRAQTEADDALPTVEEAPDKTVIELAAEAAAIAKPTVPSDEPPGWRGLTPGNLADLKEMERHLQSLLPVAQAATVGVEVGPGRGSGVIVTKDGHVMTAGHVSQRPGMNCWVFLPDGKRVRGKTLGLYQRYDVGMIQIVSEPPAGGWPCVPVGKSDALINGEWCFALGHLGGYDKNRGAVLRIGRVIRNRVSDVWTDCTLLGGDSGGPLFNMSGHVIGIHSRIAKSTEANLHVPSDVYVKHWDELATGKTIDVPRGFLGVGTVAHPRGVKVERVVEGSAAEMAGVTLGDVIVQVDGKAVTGREHFAWMVAEREAGDKVELTIDRKGTRRTVVATLGARPDQLGANDGNLPDEPDPGFDDDDDK